MKLKLTNDSFNWAKLNSWNHRLLGNKLRIFKMDVNGKVAIVTGAARGIGKAISIQLAKGGAQVIATDIDEVDLRDTHD